MSAAMSENVLSLMSVIGFQIDPMRSTDQWPELEIDTFDQWSNPNYSMVAPTGSGCTCAHDFDDDLVLV
jgi:hypothetical protein